MNKHILSSIALVAFGLVSSISAQYDIFANTKNVHKQFVISTSLPANTSHSNEWELADYYQITVAPEKRGAHESGLLGIALPSIMVPLYNLELIEKTVNNNAHSISQSWFFKAQTSGLYHIKFKRKTDNEGIETKNIFVHASDLFDKSITSITF
ncbi:hypothetical protein BH09DEP1_BH09DEP1_6360 [soil metagenome]